VDEARRVRELGQENAKLKRLMTDLGLDNLVLKDIASGISTHRSTARFYRRNDERPENLIKPQLPFPRW
jgi:hypothetical protein